MLVLSGMHKKSLEMSSKKPAGSCSDRLDSKRSSDAFCHTPDSREPEPEAVGRQEEDEENTEEEVEEEEEELEEEAMDLSSSSKQQQQQDEAGSQQTC